MRVTILAVGSQGDVQPYAALGAGLARAGLSVRLASHETFRNLAGSCGLDFASISGNPVEIVNGAEGQSWLSSSGSYLKFLSRAAALGRELFQKLSPDALKAAQGSDALIFSLPLSAPGFTVAEALRIPGIPAALYPLHPTRAFPSIMTPNLSLGAGMNWLSAEAVEQLYWRIIRSLLGTWHRSLGLGRFPVFPPLSRMEKSGIPFLYGYSPSVIPRPTDWPDARVVGGYWFAPDSGDWKPPKELLDFLEAGPAPIYVGFGSMTSGDAAGMTRVILEAVARTGQRAILSTGWGGFQANDLPDTVLPVGWVSHSWLFPRVRMAIHHGGAGTTAAILRAGVPSIVIPFFADQFFWGKRVRDLGIGAGPIAMKNLSVENLEAEIRKILGDPQISLRSGKLAHAISEEDGIGAAVAAVKRYLRAT